MQKEQLFIVAVIVAVIMIIIALEIRERVKLRNKVRQQWGKLPYEPRFDKEKSLKQAYQNAKGFAAKHSEVDDLTWYDLDLFAIFEQINHTYSSIGSEALYQRLRRFDFDSGDQRELEELIGFFKEHPKVREDVEYAFARLGKKDHNFVAKYLADGQSQRLAKLSLYLFLGVLPLIGGILWLCGAAFAPWLIIGGIVINTLYYMRKKESLERELTSMRYLVQMIAVGKRVAKYDLPSKAAIQSAVRPLQTVLRFALSFRVKSNSEAEMLFEYVNIMFMLPFISYHFVLGRLEKYDKEAVALWTLLGKLEVACAILNYRTLLPLSCQPTFTQEASVAAENSYHPLVDNAVTNPVAWRRNTLVTGSNASGKSTYVKSIAINCILAQTIYTVLAESFSLQWGHVLTSMAVEDDIFEGDSYFVAEIKSIKRVLTQVEKGELCYCFIDEILKGTNTIERIAASASIIQWLANYPALTFVATHDIELTEILKTSCENVHFSEQVTEAQGISFDYRIKQGPAVSRNAIQLLRVLDYPEAIVDNALEKAGYFDQHRRWLPSDD